MRRLFTFVLAFRLVGAALAAGADGAATAVLPAETRQLLVVLASDWHAQAGVMRRFTRDASDGWSVEGPAVHVTIGRNGCGWGLGTHPPQLKGPTKQEGDGRSPAGVFSVGPAFGNSPQIATALAYVPLDRGHWCIDVSDSPLYNQIVHEDVVGRDAVRGSSEPMRRDLHLNGDLQYRMGFVIRHNPEGRALAGSCIFAHPWIDEHTSTAGCVALAEMNLVQILAWLDASAMPRMVLLPRAEYLRLRDTWGLPLQSDLLP